MAKFSDLFGRKGGEAGAFPSRSDTKRGNGDGDHINVENFSDVGSRMGEENEALRNLLTDTGRKIGELDDLKEAFDKIVAPFNSTLRALEQEKSQSLGLSSRLDESRTAYETLRLEFYQIEKKATALEAEAERLREDLELSSESNRGLESTRLELSNDIAARHAQIVEIERQLAQESGQRRSLSEARRSLQEQFDGVEKRNGELEGELAGAREKLALLEDGKRSLQLAVDSALNETARLTRRLTESENTLTATRAQLGKVETSSRKPMPNAAGSAPPSTRPRSSTRPNATA
jgi:chromosome segregation ATPase